MSADPRKKGIVELGEINRTIRPASDGTLRGIISSCRFTEEKVPPPGPLLDRRHDIAVREAALYRPIGNRRPFPLILENLALFLQKRGDAEGAARAELDALHGG